YQCVSLDYHARLYVLFFFSSRRRHTRFSRDWSSDVCSSDLYRGFVMTVLQPVRVAPHFPVRRMDFTFGRTPRYWWSGDPFMTHRSEERRVGKECRSQLLPDYEQENDEPSSGCGRAGCQSEED